MVQLQTNPANGKWENGEIENDPVATARGSVTRVVLSLH